ncbi:MAG: adenylate/guanylate cyclase domain-containing protein [Hyphomicrobiaceae bacterium]
MVDTTSILQREDAKAESLLGIVRMAVACTLGLVLVLVVRTIDPPHSAIRDSQLLLASAIVTSYFTVGLITTLVVAFGYYRMWMAWVSAVLDVTFITGALWSSISNTGLSPYFALSFPAALMLPLVLTFGSLRVRPAIQIMATLFMGAVVSAIMFGGHAGSNLNDNTLQYLLTTHGIPPNIMRIVMIMATGGVVALAAWRARRLLDLVASEARQRANLTRFLPQGLARDMSDRTLQGLREGRRQSLAIMFIDIRDFTRMAEHMTPESVSRLLSDYRSNILDIVESNSGVVDKFIGDGALILFGVTEAEKTDRHPTSRAVNAAIELLERVDSWNARRRSRSKPEIRIGIGLHFGDVVIGAIGDERRLEITVIGDEVNVGSRIEQTTKSSKFRLLASDALIQHAVKEPTGDWEDLAQVELRGHDAAIRLWGYRPSIRLMDPP